MFVPLCCRLRATKVFKGPYSRCKRSSDKNKQCENANFKAVVLSYTHQANMQFATLQIKFGLLSLTLMVGFN